MTCRFISSHLTLYPAASQTYRAGRQIRPDGTILGTASIKLILATFIHKNFAYFKDKEFFVLQFLM